MSLFSVVGLGLVATVMAVLVKQTRPELGIAVSVTAGILIFGFVLSEIQSLISWWEELGTRYGSIGDYLFPLIKVLGVAYLTQFASQACRDAGEGAIAIKLELAGKIVILGVCVPVMQMVLELIQTILS